MRGLVLVLGVVTAACGLGLEGTRLSADDASVPPDDAGATDASLPPPPACTPVVVKDPLTSIDTATWKIVKDGNNGSYPKLVPAPESPLPSPTLSLVTPAGSSRGGLWLQTKVPTRAFDVTFSVYVRCVSGCADGLAVAWLKALDAKVLDTATRGRTLGIPPTVAGGAVAIDVYRNSQTGDGPTPSVELLAIDGAQNPGDYAWVKATGPADVTLTGALRKVSIRARAGEVEVSVDDVLAAKTPLPLGFPAIFGITAATGGEVASYFVRDFSGSFYDCDP